MNRTYDFWAAILWMYFKRIQQWGLITVPQVRILLFFEAWCSRKNVTSRFHLFPSKNVSLKSDKGNIGLLFRCVLQPWEWAFKLDFSFSFAEKRFHFMCCHYFMGHVRLIGIYPGRASIKGGVRLKQQFHCILIRPRQSSLLERKYSIGVSRLKLCDLFPAIRLHNFVKHWAL